MCLSDIGCPLSIGGKDDLRHDIAPGRERMCDATKEALNRSKNNHLDGQLDVENELQTRAGRSHDYNEGVNAFLEKRKPVYRGE